MKNEMTTHKFNLLPAGRQRRAVRRLSGLSAFVIKSRPAALWVCEALARAKAVLSGTAQTVRSSTGGVAEFTPLGKEVCLRQSNRRD